MMTRTGRRDSQVQRLERLFRRTPVARLGELRRLLAASGRTVFRVLDCLGYLSSYSHAGRYYTLRRIPVFDERGLWFHGEVRFSAHGTLRATVVVLVTQAFAGHTHEELEGIVGLRVHDVLRSLVEAKELWRERIDSVYVYVDKDPGRAAVQLERRRQAARSAEVRRPTGGPSAGPPPPLDLAQVVEVLVAVIHAPREDARRIAARLRTSGIGVNEEQVEGLFTQYDLGKKTAPSRSRRSRR